MLKKVSQLVAALFVYSVMLAYVLSQPCTVQCEGCINASWLIAPPPLAVRLAGVPSSHSRATSRRSIQFCMR